MMHFDTTGFPQPISDQIYLVGGSVRDLMLQRNPTDYDIVVTGDALRFAEKLAGGSSGHLVKLGKPGQILYRIVAADKIYDVTAAEGASITADLQRRDFGINAIAYQLANARLIDPHQGCRDLDNKLIRMVTRSIFRIDPVRLIRAYRLAADLHFSIEPHTQAAIAADCNHIARCPGERVRAELSKLLDTRIAQPYVLQMAASGLLNSILPELKALKGCRQGNHHRFDTYDHTLAAVGYLEEILNHIERIFPDDVPVGYPPVGGNGNGLLKMALLLHDIGKPATRQVDINGRVHFYGHAAKSARMAVAVCKRLRMSRRETDYVAFIIQHHLHPLAIYTAYRHNSLSRRAPIRLFMKCGRWTTDLLLHAFADMRAKRGADSKEEDEFRIFIKRLLKQFNDFNRNKRIQAPLLNGKDLIMDLGLKPGPLFKPILKAVQIAHQSGELNSRSEALNWVKAWLAEKDAKSIKALSQDGKGL